MCPETPLDAFESNGFDYIQPGTDDVADSRSPAADRPHGELPELTHNLAISLSNERERIGKELIDTLIYQLHTVVLDLHLALAHTREPHATEKIHSAITSLDDAIVGIRNAVFTKPPPEGAAAPPEPVY